MTLALQAPEGAALDFLVLFAVVLGGPALVERARIPGIIGLLLGGFLVGPNGLGLIGAGNETIPELGELGLLFLMFSAGVELDLALLRRSRTTAVGFGLLTFTLPFVAGIAAGAVLGFSTPAALLLGSLVASHTLLLYPTVREAGLASNRAVASAVGATVLTDTIALAVLAVVAGTETGSGSTARIVGELAAGLTVLTAVSFVVLPRAARAVTVRLGGDGTVRFLVTLVSFLAMAALAEVFGIEGIVGAFFAGLAMNPLVPKHGQTMHRLEFAGSALFVPVFLVSTGLLVDPAVLVEAETLRFAALFVVACLGGKAVAAALSIPAFRTTRAEAGLMFVLTAPQAAATLAATVVGFEIGLFGTAVVNAVLVLILVSIVVASTAAGPFVRAVEPAAVVERPLGERVALVVTSAPPPPLAAEVAARLARADSGVVDAVLVRRPDRHAAATHTGELAALAAYAARAGFDGALRLEVDRPLAAALASGARALDATAVVAHAADAFDAGVAPGDPPPGAPATVVLVTGTATTIGGAVVCSPAPDPSAPARTAQAVARALGARDPGGHRPVDGLRPGELGVVGVPGLAAARTLPGPPAGAALAVVVPPAGPPGPA